ncbi:MAG: hypothetical protein ACI4PO_00465 [Faecousia sp.]
MMKKTRITILLTALMLTGCGSQPVFETLGNILLEPGITAAREIHMILPDDAAVSSMEGQTGAIYLCDGYEIMVETLSAGDLNETIQALTGFCREDLTVIQTQRDDLVCYECVWSSTGEGGDQVSRTMILDDGYYHYCVTFCAGAQDSGSLQRQWQAIIDSIDVT